MTTAIRAAAPDTLKARDVEQRLYEVYTELETACGDDRPTDLCMAARLAWMEAGRVLERFCERDGIGRFSYRWPR